MGRLYSCRYIRVIFMVNVGIPTIDPMGMGMLRVQPFVFPEVWYKNDVKTRQRERFAPECWKLGKENEENT